MENKFVNAQEMSFKNPETFQAPSHSQLTNLKTGDYVKIAVGGERFWTIVSEIQEGKITAKIDNDLVLTRTHGYKYGDIVTFKLENIFAVDPVNK